MANEKRLIKADPIANGIALYVAENAYLNDTALDVLKMVAKWLEDATTVDAVEVVHGRWVKDEEASKNHIEAIYVCSACENCEAWGNTEKTNYCPNCGAKMDGDGNA